MARDHGQPMLLTLCHRLLTLKLLPRTGWLQRGLADVESIAEHSFGVAMLALLIGDMQPGLRRDRLLAIALLHDAAEALIGDLPASARRLFGVAAKQEAERKAMDELFGALPQGEEYMALWMEYVQQSSAEARLVKALDRLEMLVQAHLYERAGSRSLAEFWEDSDNGWSDEFPAVRTLAAQLVAERNDLVDGCLRR